MAQQTSGDVNGNGDFDFKSFFLDIPPVTRTIFILMFAGTALSGLGLIPFSLFILDWYSILSKFQIWRLVLTFFHAGKLGLGFLIRMYFLFTYSQQLEIGTFFGRPANYAWFLTLVAAFVMLCSTLIPSPINGGAFLIAIIHLWGRHAENVTVTMYGFIRIPAKYLSLTMLILDVIISGGFRPSDAMGLVAGHLYYFLDSVFPAMPDGKQLIFVPIWYERVIDQIQNLLGSLTGLQRGPPVAPTRSGFGSSTGRTSRIPSVAGRSTAGATTSGARTGFSTPNMRSGYSWGQGHTLGS